MELASLKTIKNLLWKYGIPPLKRLGQNFLISRLVLSKIIRAANLQPKDIVLEIGPGLGTLTRELAKGAKKVIAFEKDKRMVEILKETLKDFNNVKVIHGDILKDGNWKLEIGNSFKVAANLPYYIVSPVIRKFLETEKKPEEMILMVQKEVAQRICAKPPDMSLLAVSIQFYAEPKIISFVSKKSFWPQPKVDGAILKIIPLSKKSAVAGISANDFFKIVKAGFSQPRKQLVNNFSLMLKLDKNEVKSWLLKNKVRPSQRAETLSLKDWISLTNGLKIS